MGKETKIEWCDRTFNPWRGCTKVSAGCANCYAETFSGRNPKVLGVWGPNGTRVVAAEAQWKEPLKWNKEAEFAAELFHAAGGDPSKPGSVEYKGCTLVYAGRPRVFCASLADVFEDWKGPMCAANGQELFWPHNSTNAPRWIPDEDCGGGEPPVTMQRVRARLFEVIDATPNLDWLLLTKRPENILNMLPGAGWVDDTHRAIPVRENVWLGTSVENQAAADERIPHLLKVPAAVRFLSCEPLLGPVRLPMSDCNPSACTVSASGCGCRIDWAIVGGESGHNSRMFNIEWARNLRDQCAAAGVAFFCKQFGAVPYFQTPDMHGPQLLTLNDRKKGGDISEFPAGLQVREFPEVKAGAT